jgi:hypothetical protein
MDIDLTVQAVTFGGACVLGLSLGLVYDFMRILRRRISLRAVGPVLDLLFWLLCTGALFVFAAASGGEVRIFMVAAILLGAAVYFLALSRPVLFLLNRVADFLSFIFHLLLLPFRILGQLGKNFIKILKNHFHYQARWFKINMIPGEMDTLSRHSASGNGGAAHGKNKKGWNFDQAGHFGSAHLSGHHASQPARADQPRANSAGRTESTGRTADSAQRRADRRRNKQRRPGPHH